MSLVGRTGYAGPGIQKSLENGHNVLVGRTGYAGPGIQKSLENGQRPGCW